VPAYKNGCLEKNMALVLVCGACAEGFGKGERRIWVGRTPYHKKCYAKATSSKSASTQMQSSEKSIHRALHKKRLNKINLRKEYFRTTVSEIAKIVEEHHGELEYIASCHVAFTSAVSKLIRTSWMLPPSRLNCMVESFPCHE